jgi:hypothetical protein
MEYLPEKWSIKPADGGYKVSIDAAGITGGGFLAEQDGSYAGVLVLHFGEIGLSAVGLYTITPASFLTSLSATFKPPIQLSMGFTLSGVGGLLAVNHVLNLDALRLGLRNQVYDNLLFPDPGALADNANKIISEMRALFPPAKRQYLIGPMLKIGWGGGILTAKAGVFIEFPDPVRIALLGQVMAAFPQGRKNPLVEIHLDILGAIDFGREELSFQAALYDSRILAFKLSGESAFLLGWGRNPRFALSMGGFHPAFTPPAPTVLFADLKRLSLEIRHAGIHLACQSYLALTSNSLQFGAQVGLRVSAGPLTVTGFLGFDALFYFSPFFFEAEVRGGVQLKFKGVSLFGVALTLFLSGPTPWHIRGKARIKILFFSISVGFSATWGERQAALLEAVNPRERLIAALEDSRSWRAVLPQEQSVVEIFRPLSEKEKLLLLLHPCGRLEARQNVVPLGIELTRFNNAPVTGYKKFEMEESNALKIGNTEVTTTLVHEVFARGQFQELTNDQKLSLPSFEPFAAGVLMEPLADEIRAYGEVQAKTTDYCTFQLGPNGRTQEPVITKALPWKRARGIVDAAAQVKTVQRRGPRQQFATTAPVPRAEWREPGYCLVNAANMQRLKLGGNDNLSRAAAEALRNERGPLEPTLKIMIVPEWEVAK